MFDHTKLKVYFRKQFVDFADAKVSIANPAFCYGLSVFTGIRANKNPDTRELFLFRLDEHYKRLIRSAKFMRFENFARDISSEKFIELCKQLITTNNLHEDCYLRASIYIDETKIIPKLIGYQDDFCMFLYPMGDYTPAAGMPAIVSSFERVSDQAIPPRMKISGAYVNTALAKTEALEAGAEEAIFLNRQGFVAEGSSENIFIVKSGKIFTPPIDTDILEGITRNSVMQIAWDLGYEVAEKAIAKDELGTADEIFVTGTAAKVTPITKIAKSAVGSGEVGEITRKIQQTYNDATIGKLKQYANWLTKV